ncbi:MAG: hypothetical protein PHS38_14240 [Bacteroidales bacterium]|nr:hypothetical protein [Bacteroidales bacterium]
MTIIFHLISMYLLSHPPIPGQSGQTGQVGQRGTLSAATGQRVPSPAETKQGEPFLFDLYDNFNF